MTPLNILIVEDDLLIGLLLTDMLKAMGHDVCGVERTESGAVDSALLNRPDLMIVDARLCSGSGITAVARISATVAIPHIFVSGDRAALEGASRFVLQKPFSQRDLISAIAGTIDAARQDH
jgi:DNA-binding response OmpR family regulator